MKDRAESEAHCSGGVQCPDSEWAISFRRGCRSDGIVSIGSHSGMAAGGGGLCQVRPHVWSGECLSEGGCFFTLNVAFCASVSSEAALFLDFVW